MIISILIRRIVPECCLHPPSLSFPSMVPYPHPPEIPPKSSSDPGISQLSFTFAIQRAPAKIHRLPKHIQILDSNLGSI